MYKLSVPIMSSTMNSSNREIYVKQFREAGVERVFVALGTPVEPIPQSLIENVQYLKAEGFEVGIWIDTLGHGMVLLHVEDDKTMEYRQIVTLQGKELSHANCPLDKNFRAYIAQYIAKLAKTGTDIVMLDDDFRMSQRGGEVLSCACPLHLAKISEILGEEITLEQIRPYVLSGKANKYRDAWLKAQGDGLLDFAREIRAEVDKESPNVTVCNCCSASGWNVDNIDYIELAHILAGKNKPILRLAGGPYWAMSKFSLIGAIEFSRMIASFCQNTGVELMSEGDVYPRPRYTCPASYLEIFDAAHGADYLYDGILKYMFDYVAGPEFETGYLKFHADNMPFRKTVREWFGGGANAGVRVVCEPHTMKDADLDLSTLASWSPISYDGTMLASSGIPTVYRGEGICNSIFGDAARHCALSELKKGAILDAVSARILTERGVDVGLASTGDFVNTQISFLCTNDPEYKSFINRGEARILKATLSDKAEARLYSTAPDETTTVAYTYENTNGERFLVFLFEGNSLRSDLHRCNSGILKNAAIADVLTQSIPWVARQTIPAHCEGNPELYLMCRKDDASMSVLLANCFADALLQRVITLDESYSRIECINCEAVLDGNRVTLTSKLYGFTSAAFKVSK